MKRAHNYSAGPAVLPLEVLKEVQENLIDYKGNGLSVMEMSHRSKVYGEIMEDARNRVKKLMNIGDEYEVLFLQGGASTQFMTIPMALCPDDKEVNVIDTGGWSAKFIKECKIQNKKVHISASSKEENYSFIPKEFTLSENPAFLHITFNNTVQGTEYHFIPEVPANVPLIADMSSDIFSRKIDYSKFDMIYGGAQKNIGPAGATFVVIKKDLLEKVNDNLPTMINYNTHVKKGSMFNTPPAFSVYVIGLVLKWIEDKGGIEAIEKYNRKKAARLYDLIDSSDFYTNKNQKDSRSLMNIVFNCKTPELEAKLLAECDKLNMWNLKGHRSLGGLRASFYNALPQESVDTLMNLLEKFKKENE